MYILRHTSDIQVLEWQGIIGLVMEYAVGGPLSTLVAVRSGLTETIARWYFQQVVMAVDYCHQKVRHHLNHHQHLLESSTFNTPQGIGCLSFLTCSIAISGTPC